MTLDERQRELYLAHAKLAADNADKTKDQKVRESWLQIAEGYRLLAEHANKIKS